VATQTNKEAPVIDSIEVSAYTIPTDKPESDGTLEWDQTTLVLVQARAGGKSGIGYTYTNPAAVEVIRGKLAGVVLNKFKGGVLSDGYGVESYYAVGYGEQA